MNEMTTRNQFNLEDKVLKNEATPPDNTTLIVSEKIKVYLTKVSKWGEFLAVMGYIGIGLIALGGLSVLLLSERYFPDDVYTGFAIFYLIFAVLLYFPTNYLNNFAKKIKKALHFNTQELLDEAFENLKSLFKFYFWYVIIAIIAYFLVIIGVMIYSTLTLVHAM